MSEATGAGSPGDAVPEGRRWVEVAQNLSAQLQALADAGSREAQRVGSLEHTNPPTQGGMQ